MLNTAGVETNSIIPDLSWKMITKGKRSRKPKARSLNGGVKSVNRSPKRVGDYSCSDSDKFGEAVTKEQISDKVEHIPIKKRRHLLQSSSPSQVPSGCCEESLPPESLPTATQPEEFELLGQLNSDSYPSQQLHRCDGLVTLKFLNDVKNKVMDVKFTEVTNRKYYNTGDFSGIALLAAAACNDGIDYNSGSVEGGSGFGATSLQQKFRVSTSPFPLRPNLSVNNSTDSAEGDMLPDTKVECSTALKKSPIISQDLSERAEDGELMRSVSPKIGRLHWDLNNLMDSWEQPRDDTVRRNVTCNELQKVKLETFIPEEQRDSDIFLDNLEKCIPLTQMHLIALPSVFKTEENKGGPVSSVNSTCSEEISVSKSGHIEAIDLLSVDTGIPCHDDEGVSLADSTSDKCHHASTNFISKRKLTATSGSGSVAIKDIGYDVYFSQESSMGKSVCGNASKCRCNEDLIKTCELTDDKVPMRKATGTVDSKMLDIGTSECTSSKCVDLSASKASVGEGVSVTGEVNGKEDSVSTPIAIVIDSHAQFEPKELISRCADNCTSSEADQSFLQDLCKSCYKGLQTDDPASPYMKIGIGSSLEDGHNSDVSQEEHCQPIGSVDMSGFQAGNDSPFEDGELRGSALYSWEENELDCEMECVDYESDGDGVYSDAAGQSGSEVVEAGSARSQGTEMRNSSTSICQEADFNKSWSLKNLGKQSLRGVSEKIGIGEKKGSDAGSDTIVLHRAHLSVEGNIGVRNRCSTDHMNAYGFRQAFKDDTYLSTSKGKLQSRIEGPLYLDATNQKDAVLLQNHSPHDVGGSYTKPKRDFSSERFVGRYISDCYTRDMNVLNGNRGYWDSTNHYLSIYHGSESRGRTWRRSFAASTDEFGGTDPHDYQHSINYLSKVTQRSSVRRRSSVDRDGCVDVHRRRLPVRGGIISDDRGREGSRRYTPQIVSLFMEEGRKTLPDAVGVSSVTMQYHLSSRNHSFSPYSSRAGHISLPQRRSCSRSRTRSPHAWNSQRDRITITRPNRSPDSRSEARMERIRVPSQNSHYAVDLGEGFMSLTRDHFSPHQNSRWMCNRNFMGNYSRQRRSPVGNVRRMQRFDAVGAGRPKSGDYFRPAMTSRRFPPVASSSRGFKLEDNYN